VKVEKKGFFRKHQLQSIRQKRVKEGTPKNLPEW